jgi:hypothetical protein
LFLTPPRNLTSSHSQPNPRPHRLSNLHRFHFAPRLPNLPLCTFCALSVPFARSLLDLFHLYFTLPSSLFWVSRVCCVGGCPRTHMLGARGSMKRRALLASGAHKSRRTLVLGGGGRRRGVIKNRTRTGQGQDQEQDKHLDPSTRLQDSTSGFTIAIAIANLLSIIVSTFFTPPQQATHHHHQTTKPTAQDRHTPSPPNDQANSTGYRIATLSNSLHHLTTSTRTRAGAGQDQVKTASRSGQDREMTKNRTRPPPPEPQHDVCQAPVAG